MLVRVYQMDSIIDTPVNKKRKIHNNLIKEEDRHKEKSILLDGNLVSVIVPIYNAELYLQECLDSILIQTYRPLEVVLFNDCSTDDSFNIANNWKEKVCKDKHFDINVILESSIQLKAGGPGKVKQLLLLLIFLKYFLNLI